MKRLLIIVPAVVCILSAMAWISCERVEEPNLEPNTIILESDMIPTTAFGDTILITNQVTMAWYGTDLDNDVAAFEVKLAPGPSGWALSPGTPQPDTSWNYVRATTRTWVYDALPDGEYRFRVRSIDQAGAKDPTPAGWSFTILLDNVGPYFVKVTHDGYPCRKDEPIVRPGATKRFDYLAADSTASGLPTPTDLILYRYIIRQIKPPPTETPTWTEYLSSTKFTWKTPDPPLSGGIDSFYVEIQCKDWAENEGEIWGCGYEVGNP